MVNGTLKIYNVAKTDGGTYLCKAGNVMGAETATAQVVIFFPLRFKVCPPQELAPVINNPPTLRLPCLAESDLKPTLTWTKDGKHSLPVDSDVLRNGTLVLRNIKKSHGGSYTCRAANAVKTIEAKVKINSPITTASCSEIRKYVSGASGNYVIDPDGEGGLAPLTVFCDMTDKSGVGVTVIRHDSESRTYVHQVRGYGAQGTRVTFITQERVCLNWQVSPESLCTVNSLSNTSVIIRYFFTTAIYMDGGCHVILRR